MRKKMYVLRTWLPSSFDAPHHLLMYIIDHPKGQPTDVPYITSSRFRAKKFYTKKDAIKYAKLYGGCYVDCVWHFTKDRDPYGRTYDLWG